jgi:hypothetical protein
VENLPRSEIVQIARDIVQGEIFTSDHIGQGNESLIGSIFLPILLGGFAEYTKEDWQKVGMLFSYYKDSLPWSVNGFPIFSSVCSVNHYDAKLIWKTVKKMRQAMEEVGAETNSSSS